MKNTSLIGLGLILTILAGSTVYLASQNSKTGDLQDTANCLQVRDNFPFPTEQNPNPERTLFAINRCFKTGYKFHISYEDIETGKYLDADTPCLQNNVQFKLPFNVPDQIKNSWQTYCQ
ncbi:transmembrane protein, putative (macronuclear) [Tetrahymena thermophila SB210]|uniref:Transmembrane protein, putative n=1 Tax=Tetrahymena thermophila (strain SB210) TaxID=312017 RepID=Q22S73_TETTS|nr:transmembrane protein, putative [Tetrahymena thermophila SB210]EAR87899.1 transmembrane protein, putative [Tetrahymena thermophila SB210]|eukprot:XP_001008144.1 transmembrane protein, putative [Tetrahymena thermophila SB210]